MRILYSLLAVLLLLSSLSFLARGQKGTADPQSNLPQVSTEKSKREIVQEARLKTLLSKVAVEVDEGRAANNQQQPTYREVKIHWTASTNALSDKENRPSLIGVEQESTPKSLVLEDKKRQGSLAAQRSLELSPTQVLIVAVDEKNYLKWWSIIPDPRVVRAEVQAPAGDLQSKEYYLSDLTLVVAFPDDPKIVNLQFYHPFWTGTDFELKLLTVTSVQ
jgi:hypothetical protein